MATFAIRYLIVVMVCVAFALDSASRSSMSITIIAMVNQTNITHHDPMLRHLAENIEHPGRLSWDATLQGWILNSVYIGILLSLMPAGHLAESFSLKWVLGYGVFFMSLISLCAPFIAKWSPYAFIASRVLSGVAAGVILPGANALICRWSPIQERTLMITFACSGWSIGPIVANILAGIICDKLGWEYVFYCTGAVGVIWSLLWYFVVASSPEKHWWISEEEKMKILEEREGNFERNRHIPWSKIIRSGPVIVLCFRTFCVNIFYAIYFTYIPSFLAHMFSLSLSDIGWVNGISNVSTTIVALTSSALADRLLQAECSINGVRKTFATLATIGPAALNLLMTEVGQDLKLVVIILIATCIVWGTYGGSDMALPMDLAAEYAGAVSALLNVFANLALVLVPIVVGWYIDETEDIKHWRIIFIVGSIMNVVGAVVFLFFGSAEAQDWSAAIDETDDEQALVDPL